MRRADLAVMIALILIALSCGGPETAPASPEPTGPASMGDGPTPTATLLTTDTPAPTEEATGTPEPTEKATKTPLTRTPTLVPTQTAMPEPTDEPKTDLVPIGMEVQNYVDHADELTGLGPFHLYGWAAGAREGDFIQKVEQLGSVSSPDVTKKVLMFSSYETLSEKLDAGEGTPYRPEDLKALGIEGVFYNSERGLTPPEEMEHLLSPDPEENSVAIFVRIAKRHGFEAGWGPIAFTAYTAPESALDVMFAAGLDRIGIQEQKMIDDSCVQERVNAIREVKATYERVAGRSVAVGTQVMPGYQYSEGCYPGDAYAQQNCPGETIGFTYAHCNLFATTLESEGLVESIGIWASVPKERAQIPSLVRALRRR